MKIYLFLYPYTGKLVISSRLYGYGESCNSETGFGLGCLLGKRLGLLIGRIWVQALCVTDCFWGFGLEMWI